ncbi:MAG: alanine--tRNA ligase [Verrucomicrobia bacterium]|nr:alanine--tRNA ligase [Verrucomicrobiota bacterium]
MTTPRTAAEIRQSFLDYFRSKQHIIVPSSPVVIPTDPTLLFANAGMNQFKEIFLGAKVSEDKRVADTQKCIRVSGKHNDLEEVGIDTYHHTFFEMLGNWSFGDYYKREAIAWAWELLTGVWHLPKDRLWATIYQDDDEAEALWKDVTDIDPARILRFGEKDNFWEMGETGPCGPCSEIHIDLTENGCTPDQVNAGIAEVMEIWNLVFIQYNRKSDGSLEELPSKHVDTGMGLERVVSVMQGKKSNYDTDLFQPLIQKLVAMSGKPYEGEAAIAMRVIADHIRTLAVAIADGVLPSNEGRGYVLRRLLRRAVRYSRKLDVPSPFLGALLPEVESILGATFPELVERRDAIHRALKSEEESFAATLDHGITLFEEVASEVIGNRGSIFPGDAAFKLYDTFGFPLDLTTLMAQEKNLSVDQAGFDQLMSRQKSRSRAAGKDGSRAAQADLVAALVNKGVKSVFTGYDRTSQTSTMLQAIGDDGLTDRLSAGQEGRILLAETPFYAESGGQVGDCGFLRGGQGVFEVMDTQKPADGLILHIGRMMEGTLSVGDEITAEVDASRRSNLMRHHTSTHLLQAALKQFVNASIKQAGSMVAPDRLRFDFSHYEAISHEQLHQVEQQVNAWVIQNTPLKTYSMAFKDVAGSGITAVFDEKYGDVVRVVDIGGFSRELCGGTHVAATGDIGLFRIVGESSVAAGVRRVEAVCGASAYDLVSREHDTLRRLSQTLNIPVDAVADRVDQLLEQIRTMEKEKRLQAKAAAQGKTGDLVHQAETIGGVPVVVGDLGDLDVDGIRSVYDGLRSQNPEAVVLLAARNGDKVSFLCAAPDAVVAKGFHAGKLIGPIAKAAGGGGGGRPNKAEAGGRDPAKITEALALGKDLIRQALEG